MNYECSYVHYVYYSVVNGGWSDWVIGPCSKICGGGTRNFIRRCNNPTPSCNGTSFEGKGYLVHPGKCNNICCPGKLIPNEYGYVCVYSLNEELFNLATGQWCWQHNLSMLTAVIEYLIVF